MGHVIMKDGALHKSPWADRPRFNRCAGLCL